MTNLIPAGVGISIAARTFVPLTISARMLVRARAKNQGRAVGGAALLSLNALRLRDQDG